MNTQSASSPDLQRRSLLGKLAWLTLALVSSATTLIAVVSGFGPALRRRTATEEWSPIATLVEIPENKPTRFNIVITERVGWLANNTQEAVWLVRRGEQVVAFSAICPHAGCPIGLEARGFFCGCHGSRWAASGQRTEGPTPRDMDLLESRIKANVVEVKYQRFRTGVAQKDLNI
ncbi:MAG: Rieske (2Fe-2S) protein [Acidobacteriota bacterium]